MDVTVNKEQNLNIVVLDKAVTIGMLVVKIINSLKSKKEAKNINKYILAIYPLFLIHVFSLG